MSPHPYQNAPTPPKKVHAEGKQCKNDQAAAPTSSNITSEQFNQHEVISQFKVLKELAGIGDAKGHAFRQY